jgi:hypothetical protein
MKYVPVVHPSGRLLLSKSAPGRIVSKNTQSHEDLKAITTEYLGTHNHFGEDVRAVLCLFQGH